MVASILFVVCCIGCFILAGFGVNAIIKMHEDKHNDDMYWED